MSRKYQEDSMLKSNGIVYFPPVSDFSEAFDIFCECGGVIISLEEDGYLVDEVEKISKLYQILPKELEIYFTDVLKAHMTEDEVKNIIDRWKIDEDIDNLVI